METVRDAAVMIVMASGAAMAAALAILLCFVAHKVMTDGNGSAK